MTTAEHRAISRQVAELRDHMAKQAGAEVLEVFATEQRDLEAAGVPGSVVGPGARFPSAELLGVDGTPVHSTDVLAGRSTVVVFYRGAWCPYCDIALRTYEQQLVPALQARGVNLVAISPQSPDGSISTKDANELSFTVVSDPGNHIAAALGILTAPTEPAQAAQAELGLDLRTVNADGTVALPMPTVAVVDADSVLRWIDVHPNYATRTEPEDIVAAVDRVVNGPSPTTATTPGLAPVVARMAAMADKLGVESVLVMRSDRDSMVVAATAGPASSFYRVGAAGQKAAAAPDRVPLYCERVVDGGEAIFVRDSRLDETFAGNEDEVEFGLSNYLGLPVRDPHGEIVGTVCVLDDHSRDYDENALRELDALRAEVETLIAANSSTLTP
ncbi:peroxiredoxin-like family protein [Mycolicibacterium tusciae]|jgi:peroxiredoxin|uniref:peroxiredoxin-like family protein n=1 Tax=Mycolicibacterium tusciae TaxID=75922 RepID=UPI00024A4349|nr:peroxiredoxin-like family protein [Mycolicibacterium tusciae]